MRKFILGVVMCVAFGLPASGAEVQAAKTASLSRPAKRPACHWVSADRKLRPLRETIVQVEKRTPVPVDPTVRRTARQVSRVEPVVPASRAVAIQNTRQNERVSLMVGVGY